MADNTLEIIIKASAGQAVTTLKQVDKAIGNVGKSGGAIDTLKSKWASLNQTLSSPGGLKFLIGTAGAAIGAITGIALAAKKLTDDFQDYAFQVKDFGRIIGATPEEASKLIQVADDVRLSVSSLTVAMRTAIKQGYNPTIEGLGKLSDEYLAIQDPIARTKFLLETFGRSGLEMAKLMELGSQKIDEMGKSVEGTARLMTAEGIKAAEDYYKAMDDLGDVTTDLKITLGQALLPAVIDVTNALTEGATGLSAFVNQSKSLDDALSKGVITQQEYNQALFLLKKTAGESTYALELLADRGYKFSGASADAAENAQTFENSLGDLTEQIGETDDTTEGLVTSMNQVKSAWERLNDLDLNLGNKINETIRQINWEEAGGGELQKRFEALQRQLDSLNPNDAKAKLKDLLITFSLLQIKTGEADKWETFSALKESAQFTKEELQKVWNLLNNIDGKDAKAYLNIFITTTGGAKLTGPAQSKFKKKNFATGGDFIVPPGYSRDSFLMGVSSGEHVTVQRAGDKVTNAPVQIVNNYNIAPVAAINYRELARQVTREQQRQGVK